MIDSSDEDPEHTVCSESDGACSEESDCTNIEFVHYLDQKETNSGAAISNVALYHSHQSAFLLKKQQVPSIHQDWLAKSSAY